MNDPLTEFLNDPLNESPNGPVKKNELFGILKRGFSSWALGIKPGRQRKKAAGKENPLGVGRLGQEK